MTTLKFGETCQFTCQQGQLLGNASIFDIFPSFNFLFGRNILIIDNFNIHE